MSRVFECTCGRKTTDPYYINGVKLCVICAEDIDPVIVQKRTEYNYRKYQRNHADVEKSRYGRGY